MTPEQIQMIIDYMDKAEDGNDYLDIIENYEMLLYKILTQALEIAKGESVVVQNWQPIETAHQNHEMVLVCLPRMMNLVVRSWYDTIHKCWKSDRDTGGGITQVEFYHAGDLWMPIVKPVKAMIAVAEGDK
jgi:hypothetical protein